MIEDVKSVLNTIRNNSITEFKIIFDQTKIKAEKMDVEIRIPRITNIQQHRANTKHNDPAEYYRINIFLTYLDYLISVLNLRFIKNNNVIISNLRKIIPKYYFEYDTPDEEIFYAPQKYEADLPYSIEILRGELCL
ncbi:hypothetical protein QTP88_017535 [Uroleucon formosanum]